MNQKKIERNALIVSAVVNFLMAVAGIVVYALTGMQALFLDGFFSFFSFLSNIMAIVFSKISKKKSKKYPTGMFFLEPLYGIIKSVLVLFLLVYSTVETSVVAYDYFANGVGTVLNISPILPYSIIMVVMCVGLAIFNKVQNKKINKVSTMLTAESKSNIVDGIISAGVGILILVLYFIDINGPLGFFHYTGDFFITIILVAISLKEPIQVFFYSLREISGATVKDKEIRKTVGTIVGQWLKEEELDNKFEVYKIGMHIRVVILIEEITDTDVLERLKKEAITEIKKHFQSVSIEFVIRKFE